MTQPPDDRPRPPDEPEGGTPAEGGAAPDNEPTVAWTPPPADSTQETAPPAAAASDESQAAPTGPIISASPSGDAPPTGTAGAAAPGTGWQLPAAAAAVPQREGYVISGVGARLVAWLIDLLLVGIVPGALSLALVDWDNIISEAIRQAEQSPGQISSFAFQVPITLDYVLLAFISLGIQFLYFVGFWTSNLRATPGMIGLKMRVVDVGTGGTLSIASASKRWVVMGWPLSLLVLAPALQGIASPIQFAVVLILFFSVVLDDRRQGLHDKVANSLVIRSVTSGNGATIVGCLVWFALIILLSIIVSVVALAAVWPQLMEYVRDLPQNTV